MIGTQTSFLDNLREAVRENPLAAALIGGGALWLLMGDEKLKRAGSSMGAAAAPLADIGAPNLRPKPKFTTSPPTAPEMDNGSSHHLGDTLRDAKNTASEAASGAADAIKDRFDESVTYARENVGKLGGAMPRKETIARVQSSFSNLLERQPLLLGAIGLAVGATVAGAFSGSALESEWMGELSDNVKKDLNARAGAVAQSMREASDTLKAEVDDIGTEIQDRLQATARSGMDAAGESLKAR
jgi:hypothetical protein